METDRSRIQSELGQAIDALSEALSIAELNEWEDYEVLEEHIGKLTDLFNIGELA